MNSILRNGHELYAALSGGNVDALRELLTDNFRGELTAGLPKGLGRLYEGREAMMREGWGAVGQWFEMSPVMEQMFDGGDVLIGHGHYVGKVKRTGKPIRAAFAHFWSFDGQRFNGVTQVTDSGVWRDALA